MDDLSVGPSVRASVCPVHCGKTADQIRMPFGIIGRTGPGMRQIVGFGKGPLEGKSVFIHNAAAVNLVHGSFESYGSIGG